MSMLIISPHNNDESLEKKKKKRGEKTIVKTESNNFIQKQMYTYGNSFKII